MTTAIPLIVFLILSIACYLALSESDFFTEGKTMLAICAAGLATISMFSGGSTGSASPIEWSHPSFDLLIPYRALGISIIGVLLLWAGALLYVWFPVSFNRKNRCQRNSRMRNPQDPSGIQSPLEDRIEASGDDSTRN